MSKLRKRNELDSFDEQDFMIRLLPYFQGLKGKYLYEGYESVTMLSPYTGVGGGVPKVQENITFLADLQSYKKGNHFKRFSLMERLPKEVLTSLNPYVRIYKVFYNDDETDKRPATEFLAQMPFNNFKSSRWDTSQHQGYAPGELAVGLKSFDFDYLGNHPGEVETFIDCKLKLYFSSVKALFHQYTTKYKVGNESKKHKYSFLDLIKRPKEYLKGGPDQIARVFNPGYFRIRADVGYLTPDDETLTQAVQGMVKAGALPSARATAYKNSLADEIDKAKVSFYLTLQRHVVTPALDVPSGGFDMELTFNAAVENSLDSSGADILLAGNTAAQTKALEKSDETTLFNLARKNLNDQYNNPKLADLLDTVDFWELFDTTFGQGDLWFYRLHVRDMATGAPTWKAILQKAPKPRNENYIALMDPVRLGSLGFYGDTPDSKVKIQNLMMAQPVQWANLASGQNRHNPGFTDDNIRVVYEYYVYRAGVAGYKIRNGMADHQIRERAYSRLIRDLLSPARLYDTALHKSAPIKVYRTSVSRSVLRQFNKKVGDISPTPEESRQIRKRATEGENPQDVADSYTRPRVNILKSFLDDLASGTQFTRAGSLEGSLNSELDKYYTHLQDQIRQSQTQDRSKLPGFAQANPKVNDSDPGGLVDLRWVYFGDLVDTAIDITKNAHLKLNSEMRLNLWSRKDKTDSTDKCIVVMGNYRYTDTSGKERLFNLARFPIPLRSIITFWNKNVVAPQRDQYFLRSFIRDAYVQLVLNPLNATPRDATIGKPETYSPHYEVVSLSKTSRAKVQVGYHINNSLSPRDEIRQITDSMDQAYMAGATGNKVTSYGHQDVLFLGLQKNDQTSLFSNNRAKDIKKGIQYLNLKEEGSPVLNISFNRSDQPYLMEARAEKGLLNRATQLSEVYNCDFTTVGNMMIKPGKFIYISDPHFGDVNNFFQYANGASDLGELVYSPEHASVLLGFGGYYLVTKARHSLSAEGARLRWKTSATCFWNSFGTSLEQLQQRRAASGTGAAAGIKAIVETGGSSIPPSP